MTASTRNIEPIAGYTLRERIGAGGYGEVWKAEAPGGLAKAIKFVYGYMDGDRAARESKALNLIKTLRHPFLLSLERIEVVEGQLVIVTELADCCMKERFELRRAEGKRGIPRDELLVLLHDAADALDYMNEQHSLQHLDVKPENLLLVGDHVKVADFGLVKDIQEHTASMLGGLTPIYAAPELFSGAPSRKSDQYSLAIVYAEMLTGSLPFPGKTAAQLAAQHLNSKPLLFGLPPGDRRVIARALAKEPSQRFASCKEMVDYLRHDSLQNSLPPPEKWFESIGVPRQQIETPIGSTMSVAELRRADVPTNAFGNTQQPPATPSAPAPAPIEAKSELRSSDDIFGDLDRAVESIETEFSATCTINTNREACLNHVDAPNTAESTLRPTVVIGIGRVAGIVLQKLKQRYKDRLGEDKPCPAIEMLLLDTDGNDVQRANAGEDGAALLPQETMFLPLRRSQDYRNEGPALLQWLSRRWLFNIPRSQKPEGLRPLGRLALVDHARDVRERIGKAMKRVSMPDATQVSNQITGVKFAGPPRVIVVGAICGGTAGGMMLDVCLLARQFLERLGNAERDVVGVMLHYRGRQPAAHDLAVVNSYATLAELDYYARPERPYPGDTSFGLDPRNEDHAAVRHNYFVHLGDMLSDVQLATAADRVAEYLFLDCFSAASSFLTACRDASPPAAEDRGAKLRTFGVAQIGFASGELTPRLVMAACGDLLNYWNGDLPAAGSHHVDADVAGLIQTHQLDFDAILGRMLTEVGTRLPARPDVFAPSLLAQGSKPLDAAMLAKLDFNVVLHRMNEVLGQCGEEALGPENKYSPLLQGLLKLVETSTKSKAAEISKWTMQLAETTGQRVALADRAAGQLKSHLTSLADTARDQRKQVQDAIGRFEHLLGNEEVKGSRLPPIRKNVNEYNARFMEYVNLRMLNVALYFVQHTARRIKNGLGGVGELLMDARREIKGLISQMNVGDLEEPQGLGTEAELARSVMQEFQGVRNQLVARLDQYLQQQIFATGDGFLQAITKGGEHRLKLVSELMNAGRGVMIEALNRLDVANFLLEPASALDPSSKSRLAESLAGARPKAMADGDCRTLITISANSMTNEREEQIKAAVAQEHGALPAVIGYRESDVDVLCEISGISAAQLSQWLIHDRPDLIEFARRVFSRSDIPFQPLVPKEEPQLSK